MKHFVLTLLTFVCVNAFAQYGDNFRRYDIYGGLSIMQSRTYIYGLKYASSPSSPAVYDTTGGSRGSYVGPFAGFGLNLPIVKFTPDMSLGAHLAANLAYVNGLALNTPIGLQYRYGTDATLDCEKNVGFSVGGGYNIFFVSGDVGEGIFKYPYVSPEVSFNTGIGLLKVKSYIQFTEQYYRQKLDTETHHTYLSAPLIFCVALCPNFE